MEQEQKLAKVEHLGGTVAQGGKNVKPEVEIGKVAQGGKKEKPRAEQETQGGNSNTGPNNTLGGTIRQERAQL